METCSRCGVCCKLFMINLSKEEYDSKKYKTLFDDFEHVDDFEEAEQIGANIVAQNDDMSCIYLKDKNCSIHDKRPKVCTNFFCSSKDKQFKSMIEKIKKSKDENP